jgi:hypothetical protein
VATVNSRFSRVSAALRFAAAVIPSVVFSAMIAPETFNHIENIKKRAGHLWRFL